MKTQVPKAMVSPDPAFVTELQCDALILHVDSYLSASCLYLHLSLSCFQDVCLVMFGRCSSSPSQSIIP